MEWIIAGIIILTPIALCIAIIYWYFEGWAYNGQYISFRTFIQYYNMNPKKWQLNSDSVSILKEYSRSLSFSTKCRFGPIGFYRYLFWRHNLINQELAVMFEDKEE